MGFEVTVLMPVYNAEKYLREAVESILQQEFSNFELLVIDDCSSDSSVSIIHSFNDERIRLVRNEVNLGVCATLNKGLELATTELVARMDSDDISYSGRLKEQVAYFRLNPETVLLSTSVRVIKGDKTLVEVVEVDAYYNYYNLNFYCSLYHPSVMYRRSVIMAYGGYKLPYAEDFDLWWRIMSGNNKMGHIKTVLLDYRLSETSLSNVVKKKENQETSNQILTRNIRYYTGDDFPLSFAEVRALFHDYTPLEQTGSVAKVITCIQKLDHINSLIFKVKNVNYSKEDIAPYARIKRDEMFFHFYVKLPKLKAIYLLLKTQSLKTITGRIFKKQVQ